MKGTAKQHGEDVLMTGRLATHPTQTKSAQGGERAWERRESAGTGIRGSAMEQVEPRFILTRQNENAGSVSPLQFHAKITAIFLKVSLCL